MRNTLKKGDCKNGRGYEEVTFCILLPVWQMRHMNGGKSIAFFQWLWHKWALSLQRPPNIRNTSWQELLHNTAGSIKWLPHTGEALAQISGKMRFDTEELSAYPAVGDFVMISSQDGYPEAIIHHILTRKACLWERPLVFPGRHSRLRRISIRYFSACRSIKIIT